MPMTLPQAIFAHQVRRSAQDLGMIGAIAGVAFSYLQTRRPKLAFAVGAGMIGYFLYQTWLKEKKAEEEFGGDLQPIAPEPAPAAPPLGQEPRPALV